MGLQVSQGIGPDQQLAFARQHAAELHAEWRLVNAIAGVGCAHVRRQPGRLARMRRGLGLAMVSVGRVVAGESA